MWNEAARACARSCTGPFRFLGTLSESLVSWNTIVVLHFEGFQVGPGPTPTSETPSRRTQNDDGAVRVDQRERFREDFQRGPSSPGRFTPPTAKFNLNLELRLGVTGRLARGGGARPRVNSGRSFSPGGPCVDHSHLKRRIRRGFDLRFSLVPRSRLRPRIPGNSTRVPEPTSTPF
jgi:hypothetical protein